MSAPVVASVAPVVPATPAVKKVKAVKAAKPASAKPSHPTFMSMISDALKKLAERNGSSRQAIVKFIVANYKLEEKSVNQHVKLVLKNGVKYLLSGYQFENLRPCLKHVSYTYSRLTCTF